MKKKLTLGLAMLMASSMALAGCASKTETAGGNATGSEATTGETGTDSDEDYVLAADQTLRYNLGADPLTLDPQLNSATDASHIINNVFEGLMREKDGEVVPGIAESYTLSEDGLVYTFTLRDATWADGQPVKAGDFEFAWKRGANPATASEYMYLFESANILNAGAIAKGEKSIDELGVKAIDDKTLEVTLSAPTDYFLGLTGFATLMPVREDMVDDEGAWAKDTAKYIGNGPFKMSEYKMGDQIVLVKNENYWNAENVNLEKIVMYMIVDESTAHTRYTAGELDVNELIPTDEIPTLIAEDPTFYIMPKIGTYYYAFNMNNEALKDARVRQALSLAINREQIVKEVTKGGQKVAYGFMPEGITDNEGKSFTETAGDYGVNPKGDVEKAKALLAEAGYPDGAGLPEIEILYNTSESHKLIAEAMQEMWKQNLGINVKLTNQEWAVFQETTNNNAFDSLARRGWIGDYNDPQTMLEIFESTNTQNIGRYSSETFDTEMQLSRETMGAERMEHLYKAHDILMEDMPIIPVYYYVTNMMIQDSVHDLELTSTSKLWFGDAEMIEVQE
ncbi:peptide ABC transporter substrate-binding protein [Cellulosilyticum lentocellum]|uniref:ABC-type transporter, periplasmic subunit n=1 Tax=Cellulosilyticum lentocellum (strain ATCC 49066 / DSM 5427 / NCIMB 11756 / RHM5) TaxID=642492 RepID=F2JJ18_CELLD|nr:peptide ABC transporter substrate-binding protein [Cellulosilyticum lentocellum]ADZ83177.1 ABC-type transporter, periplasmic subunit [Cellulosilyticum lentocellum DSM 5427]